MNNKIINPLSGRLIHKNGKTHKKLIEKGIIDEEGNIEDLKRIKTDCLIVNRTGYYQIGYIAKITVPPNSCYNYGIYIDDKLITSTDVKSIIGCFDKTIHIGKTYDVQKNQKIQIKCKTSDGEIIKIKDIQIYINYLKR